MTKRIIVIPFNVPWLWSTDYLNQTAFELAKRGYIVICYLWGDKLFLKNLFKTGEKKIFKKHSDNLYIITPIFFIPFRRFKFIENLNSYLNIIFLRIVTETITIYGKCSQKIFWIFDPNLLYMYKFFGKSYYLLYDCVDFFAVGDKDFVKSTSKNERDLAQIADLVVANSTVLQKHLIPYRKDVGLVPQGFRIDGFKINRKKYINLKLKSPVIGFVGGINDRLDLLIVYPLVKNNPQWNFVFWGPVQMREKIKDIYWDKLQEILSSPNVKTGSSSDKEEIPGLVSQFDICIIPYDISQDFNKYCYPMKLFEYFYLGKPIVSTGILELYRFPDLVRIGRNYKEWQYILNDLVSKKWPKSKIDSELSLAKENSWEDKIKHILRKVHI